MHRIVILEQLSDEQINMIKEAAPGWEVIVSRDSSKYTGLLSDTEIIGSWNRHAAKECLKEGAALKWVQSWAAGVNTMPMEEFRQRNIILTNSSGVHAFPISETILAMMLSLTRKINLYDTNKFRRKWEPMGNLLEMHGKTAGILGAGEIGEETARLAKAFGMTVLGYRRSGRTAANFDVMYDGKGLDELLRQSDYVVNTLPLTTETRGLIGEGQFRQMKQSAYYINIGRGGTTDENALIEALKGKIIAGAGLDVFEREPLPADSPLWELENVIITPHDSGLTEHYNERVMKIFIPNLKSYINGQEPGINRVDLSREY